MITLDKQLPESEIIHFTKVEPGSNRASTLEATEKAQIMTIDNAIDLDEDDEYEVELILDKKKEKKRVFYFVKWKNFSMDYATWEPAENLTNAPSKIRQFEKQYKASQKLNPNRISKPKDAANNRINSEGTKKPRRVKKGTSETHLISGDEDSAFDRRRNGAVKGNNEEVFYDGRQQDEISYGNRHDFKMEGEFSNGKTKRTKLNSGKSAKIQQPKNMNNFFHMFSPKSYQPMFQIAYDQLARDKNLLNLTRKDHIQFPPMIDQTNQGRFGTVKKEERSDFTDKSISLFDDDRLSSSSQCRQGDLATDRNLKVVCFENNTFKAYPDTRLGSSQLLAAEISTAETPINNKAIHLNESLQNKISLSNMMEYQTFNKNSDSEDDCLIDNGSESESDSEYPCINVGNLSPFGSIQNGDVPIKVIGLRPLPDGIDLEVMVEWQKRANGIQPESSRVMRVELLQNGYLMPLIEFYESKMDMDSLPAYNPMTGSE